MMDISDAAREPIGEREGLKRDFEAKPSETSDEAVDEDGERCPKNLKRSLEKESMISKKRRKQLKPIRIATNLEDMVKVPKQIIGLNNDLDNVNDLSHTVPKELDSNSRNSPLFNDVHFSNPLQSETSVGHAANDSSDAIDGSRGIERPETTDLNVPSIETGPNYATNPHFLFPLSFQPVKNPTFWSEANLKIFNQEAYCDLCKKEFCNKYFLKTHKANKHGIYADVPGSSLAKLQGRPDEGKVPENGKTSGESRETDCGDAFCDLCNKKFCNKYFVRRHKSKSHGLLEEDAPGPGFASAREPESKTVQNSSRDSTKEADSTLTPGESDRERDNQRRESEDEEQEGPLNLIVAPAKAESDEDDGGDRERTDEASEKPEPDGDDCSSENIEKLQTMLLRLNPSEIESRACRVCNEAVDGSGDHRCGSEKKEKEYLSEANDSSSESKNEFGGPRNHENHEFPFAHRLDHPKQTKPTNSYCEICNKELCNKYFMRTHMQRMHGIEIEHGTQIGGVVCNICNKELCSKYFLRVHKQNTHGIVSPNSLLGPSTSGGAPGQRAEAKSGRADSRFASHFSQVCYICNKRFRSPKWLQAHFLSDHREESVKAEAKDSGKGEQKEEDSGPGLKIPQKGCQPEAGESPEGLDVISKIFWENSSASKTYNCSQCPFSTSVLAFLFVHERSHYVLAQGQQEAVKPSASLQNLIHDKTFWQHKITQQIPECLDLSAGKPKFVSFEQNGS